MSSSGDPRLARYLVTDARAGSVERLVDICDAALDGGMTTVQLRATSWSDRQLYEAALRLRELTTARGALLIVNDRLDLALASRADGVHVGVDDLPVRLCRELLGPDALIGYSPDGVDDAHRAIADGATYLGVGPVYRTATKDDAGGPIGTAGIRAIARVISVPVVGIGGITPENARAVVDAGAVGVAVIGSVFLEPDPRDAARRLGEALR